MASTAEPIVELVATHVRRRFSIEKAHEQVAAEAARHVQAPNPVGSFYFWNRTRREIALSPYALFAGVPTVYSPYIDHALFDHLASLPAEFFLDHTFHDDTIRRAYPRYAPGKTTSLQSRAQDMKLKWKSRCNSRLKHRMPKACQLVVWVPNKQRPKVGGRHLKHIHLQRATGGWVVTANVGRKYQMHTR